jgi:hypothetical protein
MTVGEVFGSEAYELPYNTVQDDVEAGDTSRKDNTAATSEDGFDEVELSNQA